MDPLPYCTFCSATRTNRSSPHVRHCPRGALSLVLAALQKVQYGRESFPGLDTWGKGKDERGKITHIYDILERHILFIGEATLLHLFSMKYYREPLFPLSSLEHILIYSSLKFSCLTHFLLKCFTSFLLRSSQWLFLVICSSNIAIVYINCYFILFFLFCFGPPSSNLS